MGTIVSSAPLGSGGTGYYTWAINPSGNTGNDYSVSVPSLSQPTIKDTSNSYFTLTSFIPSSIIVTAPNAGETWQRGTSHKVNWSYTGNPGSTVKIVLLKTGVEVGTIASSVSIGSSGKGTYTWAISPTGGTGSDYTVGVQSLSQPTIKDTSNSYFTLSLIPIPPTITVTAPNGGESWKRGTSHKINWTYTGSPGSTVKIVLLKTGVEVGTITSSAPIGSGGKGTYTWAMSTTGLTGNDFLVSVKSVSLPSITDNSNNFFTITF